MDIDPIALGATSIVGSLFVGFSIFFTKGMRAGADSWMETIRALREDKEILRQERDRERADKHEARTMLAKAKWHIDLERSDFRKFLESKGIDPNEFVFKELEI